MPLALSGELQLPRYRVSYQSATRPGLRRIRVVRSTNSRKVINDTRKEVLRVTLRTRLDDDDIKWTVEIYRDHLHGWDIISHNRDILTSHAAKTTG